MLLEIFELTDDVAILLDDLGRLRYLNRAAKRHFGWNDQDADANIGQEWIVADEVVRAVIDGIAQDPDGFTSWYGEVDSVRHDGEIVPMSVQLLAHRAGGSGPIRCFSVVARDIADRSRLERSLAAQASHDPLTGLPNRTLLYERIHRALAGLRGLGDPHAVALLFIDLDHFKSVNDSLGHELGDSILAEVARRISGVVRPGDTVARLGGDEFVVLCERLDHPEDAVVIAHRVDVALHEPVRVGEREFQLGVSIGISYADPEDGDAASLLRDADTAMYRAKSAGRGRWVIFDDALRRQAKERQRIETALRSSRDGQDLELHYQPVIELGSGRIVGIETLLRWRQGGGLISPAQFIPIAEDTGLIVPIGNWVLETACAQVGSWQRLSGWEHLRLSVNVSARQLGHASFAPLIASVTDSGLLARETLWLEITESVLLDDVDEATERLERLRSLGARMSLDDFGTGYSSLTYLRRFPVDAVKLDRSFVSGIEGDEGDAAIVSAVVQLAHSLGKECIAEGIETGGQHVALMELGCRMGQGYLYSRPLTTSEFTELLRSGAAITPA